jgi:hypothetical protein
MKIKHIGRTDLVQQVFRLDHLSEIAFDAAVDARIFCRLC